MLKFAEYAVVRIAGLPVSILESLKFSRTLRADEKLKELAAYFRDNKEDLCARLHDSIRGQKNESHRRRLLKLKRDIFNEKKDTNLFCLKELPFEKDPKSAEDILAWKAAVEKYLLVEKELDADLEADRNEALRMLSGFWLNNSFQNGVLFAQPQLYRKLTDLLSRTNAENNKVNRRLYRSAFSYLYRMATKTTPFSSFATVGIERISAGNPYSPAEQPGETDPVFLFNSMLIRKWAATAGSTPILREHQALSVNETVRETEDGICFLSCNSKVEENGSIFNDESLIDLKPDPMIDAVLKVLAREPERFTSLSLAEHLSRLVPLPEDYWRKLINKLTDVGLLKAHIGYETNSRDAIGQIARAKSLTATSEGRSFMRSFSRISGLIQELGDAPATGCLDVLEDIREAAGTAFGRTGNNDAGLNEQTMVHQDLRLSKVTSVPYDSIASFEPAMKEIAGILPLFNFDFPNQRFITDFFLANYSPGGHPENILDFFSKLTKPGRGNPGTDTGPFPADMMFLPEVAEMVSVRDGFIASISEIVDRNNSGAVELPAGFMAEWGNKARSFAPTSAPLSVAFLGHLREPSDSEPVQFVYNKTTSGYGTLIARYGGKGEGDSASKALADSLKRNLEDLDPNAEVVELIGTFGFDGQIRPRLTERRLVYPGEESNGAGKGRISWQSLAVVWDESRAIPIIVDKESGKRILPVHLGTLSPAFFPPFYRLVTCFGPAFSPDLPLLDLLDGSSRAYEERSVRHYRRICLGNVVLMRESWCVPHEEFPSVRKEESDFSYFGRLRTWAKMLGLPRQVFFTGLRTEDYLRGNLSSGSFKRLRKPIFVDWDDFLSHQFLRRFVPVEGGVLSISEMLPLAGEQRPLDNGHITEHIFEFYGG
jgi:hypothetical protein